MTNRPGRGNCSHTSLALRLVLISQSGISQRLFGCRRVQLSFAWSLSPAKGRGAAHRKKKKKKKENDPRCDLRMMFFYRFSCPCSFSAERKGVTAGRNNAGGRDGGGAVAVVGVAPCTNKANRCLELRSHPTRAHRHVTTRRSRSRPDLGSTRTDIERSGHTRRPPGDASAIPRPPPRRRQRRRPPPLRRRFRCILVS